MKLIMAGWHSSAGAQFWGWFEATVRPLEILLGKCYSNCSVIAKKVSKQAASSSWLKSCWKRVSYHWWLAQSALSRAASTAAATTTTTTKSSRPRRPKTWSQGRTGSTRHLCEAIEAQSDVMDRHFISRSNSYTKVRSGFFLQRRVGYNLDKIRNHAT